MNGKDMKVAFESFVLGIALAGIPIVVHAQTATAMPPAPPSAQIAPAGAPVPNDIASASSKFSSTSVFVGGTSIMRVRFGADGMSPEQRAAHIQGRVNKLLGQDPIRPEEITVDDVDTNDTAIYVKGQLLLTADQATARYNTTTPHALAESWAAMMRRVLVDLTRPK